MSVNVNPLKLTLNAQTGVVGLQVQQISWASSVTQNYKVRLRQQRNVSTYTIVGDKSKNKHCKSAVKLGQMSTQ